MSVLKRFINWVESIMNIAILASRRRRRSGSAFVTPTSITVQPSSPVVVVGRTTQLTAVNQLGQQVQSLIVWSSSDNTKATINSSTGVVTGVAAGSVTFTASWNSGALTGTKTVTVAAQTLTTAVMTTAPTTVVTTHTVTYAATGYDQLGFAMTSQPTFTFASGTPATATINSSTGVATGVATGTTSITATSGAVTTPGITLTDIAQVATTLVPSPSSLSVSVGSTSSAITAGVFDQLGSPISGATLSFTTSDATKATVDSGGVVTGVAAGTPTITVSSTVGGGTAQGTVSVTVTAYSLTVSPASISGAPAGTVQLTVTENGVDVTSDSGTGYATSDATIATVDAPTITSLSYSTINQNDSSVLLTITGTNARSSGQTLAGLTTGLTQSGFTQTSSTTWTVSLSASNTATLGTANIYIADTNHGNSGTSALTVANATPTLTSVSPNTIVQGTGPITYTFTGTKFRSGQTIGGLPSGVSAGTVTVVSSTSITVPLTATGSATTGAASVDIVDSTYGTSGTQTLTVNASGGITTLPVTSGLALRLHAEAGVTTATGVSSWVDQVSGTTAVVQATGASQPGYIASAYNSKHCLRFNGSSQYLASSGVVSALNTQDATVFAVMKVSGGTGNRYAFANVDLTAGVLSGYAMIADQNLKYSLMHGDGSHSGNWVLPAGLTDSSLHAVAGWMAQGFPTKQDIYVDGTNANSDSTGAVANTTKPIAVGCLNSTLGSLYFNGDVCEIICFNRGLTSTELTSMKSYFQSEWGTP